MASITLTGTLLDPTGEVAVGDQIRFTHRTTTGETIQFARSVLIIPPNGLYNITLEFGLIFVEYLDVKDVHYKNLGVVTVNGDTTATDLPGLLNAIVPPTDAQLLLFQGILADTEDARDIALLAAAQQTTLELIASTTTHPNSTVLTLSGHTLPGDGGGGKWQLNGTVGQTPSQSPTQLTDFLLNDGNGNQWALVDGVVLAFNAVQYLPLPFGATGNGNYAYNNNDFDKITDPDRLNPATLEIMIGDVSLLEGDIVRTQETIATLGASATYKTVLTTSVTPDGTFIIESTGNPLLSFVLQIDFGVIYADWTAILLASDATPFFIAAINEADALSVAGNRSGEVHLTAGRDYTLQGNVPIPANIEFNCHYARVHLATGASGFTLGTSDTVLTFTPRLLNINLLQLEKTSKAVLLRATRGALVTGLIEGDLSDLATRTNIGVHVDARDVASFFNVIEVLCNHVHNSFLIKSTGAIVSSITEFRGCTAFGDRNSGDTTSVGYKIEGQAEGQGMQIIGGNIEQCEDGVDVGDKSGAVAMFGIRFEPGGNTTDIRFRGNSFETSSVIGCTGHNTVVFDQPTNSNVIFYDVNGRLGVPGRGQTYKDKLILDAGGGSFGLLTPEGASGTGAVQCQAGNGSPANGGGWRAYAAAHATFPGDMTNFITGSGTYRVTAGWGEAGNFFRAKSGEVTPGADNVSSCGSISFRYTELFSVNSTINTSDADLKTPVQDLTLAEFNAGKEIITKIGSWQWLAKVAVEGEDARIHYGPTVQAVMLAFENNEIDPFTRSLVCYDEWDDIYEPRGVIDEDGNTVYERRMMDGEPVLDKDGAEIYDMKMEPYLIKEAGNAYGLRKEEFLMFLFACNHYEMSKINARLDALEAL